MTDQKVVFLISDLIGLSDKMMDLTVLLMAFIDFRHPKRYSGITVNKARPLCDLIKLNTILAQEYVAGKASTGTHVTSDLLNTGRSTWHYTPLLGS